MGEATSSTRKLLWWAEPEQTTRPGPGADKRGWLVSDNVAATLAVMSRRSLVGVGVAARLEPACHPITLVGLALHPVGGRGRGS